MVASHWFSPSLSKGCSVVRRVSVAHLSNSFGHLSKESSEQPRFVFPSQSKVVEQVATSLFGLRSDVTSCSSRVFFARWTVSSTC